MRKLVLALAITFALLPSVLRAQDKEALRLLRLAAD